MAKEKSQAHQSDDLPDDIEQAIKDLPPDKQSIIVSQIEAHYYRGQLPALLL